MQIPPSPALLHALSRAGEGAAAHAPRRPAPRQDGAEAARDVTTPDAARAAARAAFQALKPDQPKQLAAAAAPQAPAAPPQPAKQYPRGSFLNVLV